MIASLAFYRVRGRPGRLGRGRGQQPKNPVHSVLFLILAFFNAAGLFLLAGAEFLAMILVIVYVGAVAVLFLFVVMMLDVNFDQLREGYQRYAPDGGRRGRGAVRGADRWRWAAGSSRRNRSATACPRSAAGCHRQHGVRWGG